MLSTFSRRTTILRPSYGIANFFSGAKAAEVPPTSSRPASVASAAVNAKTSTAAAKPVDKVIVARKSNINQSPLKIKFLVSLIRDAWMPDALAQMKFSPKPRAQDVAKILKVSTNPPLSPLPLTSITYLWCVIIACLCSSNAELQCRTRRASRLRGHSEQRHS